MKYYYKETSKNAYFCKSDDKNFIDWKSFNNLDEVIVYWLKDLKKPNLEMVYDEIMLSPKEKDRIMKIWNQYKDLL
jgi:hypothetical protein